MGVDRRGFVKFVLGGAVGSMLTPIPWKLTDDISIWTQNWPWIPRNFDGAEAYASVVSKTCPSNVGMQVRKVGGQPVKLRGNPDSPLSGGSVTSLAGSEVQLLYSPSRVKRPLRRSGDGTFVSLTWDEAAAMLEEKLGAVIGMPGKLASISGDPNGTINEVFSGFLSKAGSREHYIMPGEAQPASQAWEGLMGGSGQVGYDIENADFVLAIGADILESWGPVVRNRKAFSDSHPHVGDKTATFVYAGPVENNTASVSEQWIPVRPGGQAAFALSLAYELIKAGASTGDAYDFAQFRSMVTEYFAPQNTEAVTGVKPAAVQKLAKELMSASKPLVIPGSEFGQGASAATIAAGLGLNLLLGRLDAEGGIKAIPHPDTVVSGAATMKAMLRKDLVDYSMKIAQTPSKAPEALLIYDANPLYALPGNAKFDAVMKAAPFKVAFCSFLHETARECDLVLPIPTGLERYDDVVSPYGVGAFTYCANAPATEPYLDVRNAGDVMLTLASRLGMNLGFDSFESVLQAKAEAVGADWSSLTDGEAYVSEDASAQMGLAFNGRSMAEAAQAVEKGLVLAPMYKLNFGTSVTATPPFGYKTIRNTELLGKDSFVWMNSSTASKLNVAEGDMVSVESKGGKVNAKVHVFEFVMDDVVAAPLGMGHTAFDYFSENKGVNFATLLTARKDKGSALTSWDGTGIKIAKA